MTTNPGTANNPANTMRFDVTIDGVELGSFTALDGLSAEYEVKTHAEGGENTFVHKLPGRLSYGTVKLTRPLDQDSPAIGTWFRELAAEGRLGRSTASIEAYNDNSDKVATWSFTGVWPVKYTGPSFAAGSGSVALESFEFAHNGLGA